MTKTKFTLWMIPTAIGIVLMGLAVGLAFAAVMIYTAFAEDVPQAREEGKHPLSVAKGLWSDWFGSNW